MQAFRAAAARFVCSRFVLCAYFCFLIVLALPFVFSIQHTNINAPGEIRTRNPRMGSTAGPRLRLLGHCDRRSKGYVVGCILEKSVRRTLLFI